MRKYLLPSALILAFGLALAGAQTITKSIQLTQDPRSPIGMDASNNAYFPAHIAAGGSQAVAPATSSCGTGGSPGVVGPDNAGVITEGAGTGTGVTGCTITFNAAWNTAPVCTVSSVNATAVAAGVVSTSTTTLVVINTAATSLGVSYICLSKN